MEKKNYEKMDGLSLTSYLQFSLGACLMFVSSLLCVISLVCKVFFFSVSSPNYIEIMILINIYLSTLMLSKENTYYRPSSRVKYTPY